MKRKISLLLVLVMAVTVFAGCKKNNANNNDTNNTTDSTTGNVSQQAPESALQILQNVWNAYGENEKFPIIGGNLENPVDNAPGDFNMDHAEGLTGNLVIPAFSVGRTQELLYFIREMKQQGLVKSVPEFPVYVDSPLAGEATRIFSGDLHGYLDEEAIEAIQKGNLFQFPGLCITESSDESKALNTDKTPKVIISASGMCDAGRIRHHLKHNLWRSESTVVFVGFQSPGSLGRRLLEGAAKVKLFGEEIIVRANIVNFPGLSSHADKDGLLDWIRAYTPKPRHVFVVHGEHEVTEAYAQTLRELGFDAHSPDPTEVYDLLADKVITPGAVRERKMTKEERKTAAVSPAFQRLEGLGRQLLRVIDGLKGRPNKDLDKFSEQLKSLINKWS